MGDISRNEQLVARLADDADVKPAKAKRILEALEQYVEIIFPEACTYTFSHTKEWCGHPLCRES
jgi:hypothetical protein